MIASYFAGFGEGPCAISGISTRPGHRPRRSGWRGWLLQTRPISASTIIGVPGVPFTRRNAGVCHSDLLFFRQRHIVHQAITITDGPRGGRSKRILFHPDYDRRLWQISNADLADQASPLRARCARGLVATGPTYRRGELRPALDACTLPKAGARSAYQSALQLWTAYVMHPNPV